MRVIRIMLDGYEIEILHVKEVYVARADRSYSMSPVAEDAARSAFQDMAVRKYGWSDDLCAICEYPLNASGECHQADCDLILTRLIFPDDNDGIPY